MKKVYISPVTRVDNINVQQAFLTGSITGTSGADGLGVSNQSTGEAGITSGAVKRGGYNVWDDDWSN